LTRRKKRVEATHDSAQTTDENRRHWANADDLSPNAAVSIAVRKKIRSRARYEVANNTYAKGMISTLVNYVIGTGPRLQMLTDIPSLNDQIEKDFMEWAIQIQLAAKLCTMKYAEVESGESFVVLRTNPLLLTPSKLDLRLIEADQVLTPFPRPNQPANLVDGILLDKAGNPQYYYILNEHPGDLLRIRPFDFKKIPARQVLHIFREDRPGQRRGVSQISAALPLFAQLRRYTLAVLSAAESAALPSGVIYSEAGADAAAAAVDPLDAVEMDRNTWMTMPFGWKIGQIKAEQPTTVYSDFKAEILNEIARVLDMPYNIAAGNSSGYNYASGRLDHQAFYKAITIHQARLVQRVLDPLFNAWIDEMVLVEGLLPPAARKRDVEFPRTWFFDGLEHVDPAKEALAQATRLASNTTTLAEEYAKKGKDWQIELRQRGKERELMLELGLEVEVVAPDAADRHDLFEERDDVRQS